ncbi:multiprotein-bridging factor 1 family protein [Candidatus Micrarchaeota archaeon]|nr:multiprotein-bridging factor 1 family protein [Candidatus Micrarchaeota archaeon]
MQELFCDICGKSPVRAQILLEGARLLACGNCMRGGKVLHRFDDEGAQLEKPMSASPVESAEEIAENYGKMIKAAREKSGLPLAVIAERTREKESYLHAIEHERLIPTIEVARKLEHELGIRLVEKTQSVAGPAASGPKAFTPPTLADMIDTRKKGKGK